MGKCQPLWLCAANDSAVSYIAGTASTSLLFNIVVRFSYLFGFTILGPFMKSKSTAPKGHKQILIP